MPATATPTAVPAAPTPDGWTEHKSGDVTISLPADWEVLALSQGDLQAVFADFQKTNPELAKIIGSAEALQGVALWAFRAPAAPMPPAAMPRSPITSTSGAARSAARKSPTWQMSPRRSSTNTGSWGSSSGATETDLQIDGHPAAHIAFSYPVTLPDGTSAKLNGQQYLVATPTDLWILSYSAGPGSEDAMQPVFEQSAESFQGEVGW